MTTDQAPFIPPPGATAAPTLAGAALTYRQALDVAGTAQCPCCGEVATVYRRSIYKSMARWLVNLVMKSQRDRIGIVDDVGVMFKREGGWVEVHELAAAGGDYAKLVWWGLIEQGDNLQEDTTNSGRWRPTPLGIHFAMGDVHVPKWCWELRGVPQRFSEAQVSITATMGKDFDYRELYG